MARNKNTLYRFNKQRFYLCSESESGQFVQMNPITMPNLVSGNKLLEYRQGRVGGGRRRPLFHIDYCIAPFTEYCIHSSIKPLSPILFPAETIKEPIKL